MVHQHQLSVPQCISFLDLPRTDIPFSFLIPQPQPAPNPPPPYPAHHQDQLQGRFPNFGDSVSFAASTINSRPWVAGSENLGPGIRDPRSFHGVLEDAVPCVPSVGPAAQASHRHMPRHDPTINSRTRAIVTYPVTTLTGRIRPIDKNQKGA